MDPLNKVMIHLILTVTIASVNNIQPNHTPVNSYKLNKILAHILYIQRCLCLYLTDVDRQLLSRDLLYSYEQIEWRTSNKPLPRRSQGMAVGFYNNSVFLIGMLYA